MRMKYAKSDFVSDSLPATRKQQFKAIFKNEWKTLLFLGFLFLIPFILYALMEFIRLGFLTNINNNYSGSEDSSQLIGMIFYVELIYNASLLIPYILFGLVLAGTSRVFQRLIYGEGLLFKGDFFHGIKTNFKQILILVVIYWILQLITSTGNNLFAILGGGFSVVLSGILVAISYFIFIPILFVGISFSTTYQMKMGTIISNSFKIFVSFILIPLLFGASLFGLTYLNKINSIYLEVGIEAIIVLLFVPTLILVWKLYLTSIFDEYINADAYPKIYHKGLRTYISEQEE